LPAPLQRIFLLTIYT